MKENKMNRFVPQGASSEVQPTFPFLSIWCPVLGMEDKAHCGILGLLESRPEAALGRQPGRDQMHLLVLDPDSPKVFA